MVRVRSVMAMAFVLTTPLAPSAIAASFTFHSLAIAGQSSTLPSAINSNDVIVGTNVDGSGAYEGFVFKDGMSTIVPGSTGFGGINADGIAVGSSPITTDYVTYNTNNAKSKSVRLRSNYVDPLGIDDAGAIVAAVGVGKKGNIEGAILNGKAITALNVPHAIETYVVAINDSDAVAGTYEDQSQNQHGYVYSSGAYSVVEPPGSTASYLVFLDSDNAVGGSYSTSSGALPGFILQGGNYMTFGFPNALTTSVDGIGPGGQIIGSFEDSARNSHGFVYSGGVYHQIDYPQASSTNILGVSGNGTIFGNFIAGTNRIGFYATCPASKVCTQ